MSGHSKWSTIKHKKAAQDAKRGKAFSKIIKEVTVAARIGGGDLAANPRLRTAIAAAKAENMPKDNIERAIKKGIGELEGANYEEVTYEGYGPGGVALIIQAVTDNNNRTAPEIRHIFSKAGLELGAPGSANWAFTKTDTGYTPNTPMELDEATGEKLSDFIEKLEEQDDIINVYTTADTPE